eukprot:Selendium_serpulae@DN4837_c0_g1_i1.p1
MPTISVSVKWGTKTFKAVPFDSDGGVAALRSAIAEVTAVPSDRQKIVVKGAMVKNGSDLKKIGVIQGAKLMMIGTSAGEEITKPERKVVFVEDLGEEHQDVLNHEKHKGNIPVGLVNMGTTCYMNAVLQFLRPARNFIAALEQNKSNNSIRPKDVVANAARDLLLEIERRSKLDVTTRTDADLVPLEPFLLHNLVCAKYTQFNRRGEGNRLLQQDAEEFLVCLMQSVMTALEGSDTDFFNYSSISKTSCVDATDEAPENKAEPSNLVLKCFMGNYHQPVYHLHEGIDLNLNEKIVKQSPTLKADATYQKQTRLSGRLPQYLIVHLVRFEWKEAHDLARTQAGRAKVCRKIQFSRTMDVLDFCSEDLQKQLKRARSVVALRLEQDSAARNKVADGKEKKKRTAASAASSKSADSEKKEEKKEDKDTKAEDNKMGDDAAKVDSDVPMDAASSNSEKKEEKK